MKPEKTLVYKELSRTSLELGQAFINRWFVPEVQSQQILEQSYLEHIGDTLKSIGQNFPKSDPTWSLPSRIDRLSMLSLYDLNNESARKDEFPTLWRNILNSLNTDALFLPEGTDYHLRKYDFLVTTPLDLAAEHVKEAEGAIKLFNETGKIDYYYRNLWSFPKECRIGSKFIYVDNRAIRGFAVVTNIVNQFVIHMDVNTWRWIYPIPCDYGKIKPPQSYAQAIKHQYFAGIDGIKIIGEWLDPMPTIAKLYPDIIVRN